MTSPRRLDPVLLVGDMLAIVVFAAMGRAEHQTGLAVTAILGTAAPFAAAWLGVGLWLRTFHPDRIRSVGITIRSIILPWLLAWPIGLQLRALILDRSIPLSFALVVLVTQFAVLAAWRVLYTLVRRPKGREASS